MDQERQSSKRALYHGIEPAVHYPRGAYPGGTQVPSRSLAEVDFETILSTARGWLGSVGTPEQALELALRAGPYKVDIQTFGELAARIEGHPAPGLVTAGKRESVERAVFASFPSDSRQRRGNRLTVIVTDDAAAQLHTANYSPVVLGDLTDSALESLATVVQRTARDGSSFAPPQDINPIRETDNGARHMLRLSSEQKTAANQTLAHLDKLAQSIQNSHKKWGMPFEAAKHLVNHLDRIADTVEALVYGNDSLHTRQAEVAVQSEGFRQDALGDGLLSRGQLAKAAKVLQRDSDEPYMDTFKNPMSPIETDSDEPYMSAYGDDQSSAVVEGEDDTGRELAPEA